MALKFSRKTKPKEVLVDDRLRILWADGHQSSYDFYELRCACLCASCVHEITGEQLLDFAKVPQDVHIVSSEYVGNYALGITWSDGHSSGLYSFERLRNQLAGEPGPAVS